MHKIITISDSKKGRIEIMSEKKIFVWVKRPGEEPKHVWVSNSLKALQKNVGGYIETATFGNLVVICNEEGRNMGLPRNCGIAGTDFVGTIILAGVKGDEFANCPIADAKELKRRFPWMFRGKQFWKITTDNDIEMYTCRSCGGRMTKQYYDRSVGSEGYNFCPYCGESVRKTWRKVENERNKDKVQQTDHDA